MSEPSDSEVGHLISFECGHTGKPLELETVHLRSHLEAAGFIIKKTNAHSLELT